MRTAAIVALVVAVGVLGVVVRSHDVALKDLEARADKTRLELQEVSSTAARRTGLELAGQCATQSARAFKEGGWGTDYNFEDHYNEKLNRCLIAVFCGMCKTRDTGHLGEEKLVFDAFERKELATYLGVLQLKTYRYLPVVCTVTLPSGEQKACHSHDEFEGLVNAFYMR
jgi:hypothetical protein